MSRASPKGKGKAQPSEKELYQFLSARACLTKEQMVAIEEAAGGQVVGYARRVGLLILTQSVPKLRKDITKDDKAAEAFADAQARISWLIDRQKELTDMLINANIRLLAAFTDRKDADQLLNAAHAEMSRPN